MLAPRPRRPITRLALALALAFGVLAIPASSPSTASALSRWTGGIDLYRVGVFTTQKTWLWCTAADVQIMRNIVDRQADHSRARQGRYFDYMRAHNRYRIPVRDGVDPAGWTAGLRAFVDGRYRLIASPTFDSALRSAVTNLRKTNLPVGITVSRGNHAWVLTGFTATADPALTARFTVTSVRVVGPLYGLQSRSYGYDMRPDRMLTPAQLRGFFTPWHYAGVRMAWEARWVSIQPIPVAAAKVSVSTSAATPTPTHVAAAGSTPSPSAPAPAPTSAQLAIADTTEPPRSTPPAGLDRQVDAPPFAFAWLVALGVVVAGLVVIRSTLAHREGS
jgi:cell division septation protein DedD